MKKKSIIIASCVALGAVIFSCLGFSGILKQKSKNTNYADWMSHLADSTSLRDINMPGSHDTMALYSIADLAGQCQSLSLGDQLNLGVRFLDIRLKEENNSLKAVHGFIDQHASFSDITSTVESFLENHPTEFIIMSIKEEADSSKSTISFEEAVKNCLKSDVYLKETSLPTSLGTVRGKVMLLSRYANSSIGIPAYNGWADSTSFTLPNDIYVQDTYKIKSKEEKQDEIIKCFNESGHALKINFLSAYRTNYLPPSYAPSAALDIDPWINANIDKYNDRGIVLYDFVNETNMTAFFKGVI